MTISPTAFTSVSTPAAARAALSRLMSPSVARTVLAHALALGVAADALFRLGPGGVAWGLWTALAALTAISVTQAAGRALHREAAAWLAVAVLAAFGMAWRDAGLLRFADFWVTLGALVMAAITVNYPPVALLAQRLRDTMLAIARTVRALMLGAVRVMLDARADGVASPSNGARARTVLRPALIAAALLVVFGTLLRNADPIFASFVQLPDVSFGVLVSHIFLMGFFAWATAGWARAALGTNLAEHQLPEHLPFSIGTADVTTALGTLTLLFAAYVLSQLGWFFGGESFLHERTGLTAAQYARQGFFQMLWVVLLVVPLLLSTRAALRDEPGLVRRHTMLSIPLLVLLGAMIVSAMLRMRLYVHYFGLTIDRFYPLVLMGWLTFVLAWLAATVLRNRGHYFVAGSVLSGLAVLAVLHISTPDVIVARANIARAASSHQPLDLPHLAALGGDAVPLAVRAVLTTPAAPADERCASAGRLLGNWGPTSGAAVRADRDASWRIWNAGEQAALRAVTANSAALRRVRHEACAARQRQLTVNANATTKGTSEAPRVSVPAK